MAAGKCGWHKSVRVGDRYVHVHITKADYSARKGYHAWTFPPRIGIEFREKRNVRGDNFIPNIDVAELVRFIKILRNLQQRRLRDYVESGKFRKFIIEQTPKRRIRFDLHGGKIELEYMHVGWDEYAHMVDIKRWEIPRFIDLLEDALYRYLRLIRTWHESGKLPEQFKREID